MTQLELFPQPKASLWVRFITRLLAQANSNPPDGEYRSLFYNVKTRLLERHGCQIGEDWQHIVKRCHSCDGLGWWGGHLHHGGEPCYRCKSGIYDEFWVRLERWKIAGSVFHIPRERVRYEPAVSKVNIEGLIEHDDFGEPEEAAMWLFLFFDRKTFFRIMRDRHYRLLVPANFRTPLLLMKRCLDRVRRIWRACFPKRKRCPVCFRSMWRWNKGEYCSRKCFDEGVPF